MQKEILKSLTGNEVKVLLYLTEFAPVEADGTTCISQPELSSELNIAVNTVNKVINSLLQKELIHREIFIKNNLKHSMYRLTQSTASTGSTSKTAIDTNASITEIAIAEFPELAGLSDSEVAIKIFNKCLRKQADKYKYRSLLEQFGYDKKITF